MKRLVLALFTLGALLMGSPSSIQAQQLAIIDVQHAIATTDCVPNGTGGFTPVSVINMEYLDSAFVDEIKVHEAEHVRQYKADPSLCREVVKVRDAFLSGDMDAYNKMIPHWLPRLMHMEVGAYCASSVVPVSRGVSREAVYFNYLQRLKSQFGMYGVGSDLITRTWFNACSKLLP